MGLRAVVTLCCTVRVVADLVDTAMPCHVVRECGIVVLWFTIYDLRGSMDGAAVHFMTISSIVSVKKEERKKALCFGGLGGEN